MRDKTIAAITATLCAGLIGATAQAAGPVTQRSLSLDMANRIAAAGVAACAAKGYAVAVAVVGLGRSRPERPLRVLRP